jgi:hypothetical protein
MAGMGLALQAMWAANVLDIQKTLHQVGLLGKSRASAGRPRRANPSLNNPPPPIAPRRCCCAQVCKRLLKEPGLPKHEARLRAAALTELGRIYCDARVAPELQQSQESQMEAALKKLQELYMGGGGEGDADAAGTGAAHSSSGGGSSQARH